MTKYIEIINKSKLFNNIDNNDIPTMLNCLSAKERTFNKGEFILHRGDIVKSIYVVAEGQVHIIKEDYWGNESILAEVGQGEIFGEAYACIGNIQAQINAIAIKATRVIEMDINKVLSICSKSCKFHSMFIHNLLSVVAEKNILLTNKVECMAQRTTRNKILSYLSLESQKCKCSEFDIPFNRQQMADFLSVDRSALSKELSKMQDEGVILFNKNHFEIK